MIDFCKGICGRAYLIGHKLSYDPFVEFSFLVGGTDNNGDTTQIDITSWGGLCITYTSSKPVKLVLGTGEEDYIREVGDFPYASLIKMTLPTERCFEWSEFKQMGWSGIPLSGPEAAAKATNIAFQIQSKDNSIFDFNIIRIVKYVDR